MAFSGLSNKKELQSIEVHLVSNSLSKSYLVYIELGVRMTDPTISKAQHC